MRGDSGEGDDFSDCNIPIVKTQVKLTHIITVHEFIFLHNATEYLGMQVDVSFSFYMTLYIP